MVRKLVLGSAVLLVLVAPLALAAPAQAGEIKATVSGSPGQAIFTVTGTRWPPNTPVRINVVDGVLNRVSWLTTTYNDGTFATTGQAAVYGSRVTVKISATTDGITFSNVVTLSTP